MFFFAFLASALVTSLGMQAPGQSMPLPRGDQRQCVQVEDKADACAAELAALRQRESAAETEKQRAAELVRANEEWYGQAKGKFDGLTARNAYLARRVRELDSGQPNPEWLAVLLGFGAMLAWL